MIIAPVSPVQGAAFAYVEPGAPARLADGDTVMRAGDWRSTPRGPLALTGDDES
ncbi:MAG: hypothetical protein M5T61_15350 [Acidimicrobiia bacterium]|nr:hypothetical protein [Acidimicrobiia bacterium]